MARLVRLTSTSPLKIEPGALPSDKAISICTCGLSAKFPFCDGSHAVLKDEAPGVLYRYGPDRKTILEQTADDSAS